MLPVTQFIEKLQNEGAAPKTIAFYGYPVKQFALQCTKSLDQVTAEDVYAFRDTITSSDYARHNNVRALKYFLRRMGHKLEIKLPSFTPPAPDEYLPQQLKTLFAHATEKEKRLFSFYLMTGCREQEAQHATWDCLTDTEFTVQSQPEFGWNPKKFKTRQVPVPDCLVGMLEPLRSTGLIFPNKHGKPDGHHLKKLQVLAKRSGLDPAQFSLQKFRRTFATTHLRNPGTTIHDVAAWLGHSDLDTVMRYLALANGKSERVRSLANSAFGGL